MPEALKPCPCCGSPGRHWEAWNFSDAREKWGCESCGLQASTEAAWNRRTPGPATARVLKEAAAMLIDDDGSEITGGAYEFPCFTRRELRAFIAEHDHP